MSVPTRLIIVLSKQGPVIRYAMRADVPVGQEGFYKVPNPVSPVGNASDPDLPHIALGEITETVTSIELPQSAGEGGAAYKTRAQNALQAQQVGFQASITAATPLAFYGAFFNGTTWANTGA